MVKSGGDGGEGSVGKDGGTVSGKLFLVLGPSGAGKGVTIAFLRKAFPEAVFPVSCTTRPPRPGEKNGEVYYFLTKEEFVKRVAAGDFLEWATVHHDHQYGTLKKPILEALAAGRIVIREVDMQGVQSIQGVLPKNQWVSIFLTTSSWDVLKDRILRRQDEPSDELMRRRESFEKEMTFSKQCDYVVESREGELPKCFDKVAEIIRAHHSGVV